MKNKLPTSFYVRGIDAAVLARIDSLAAEAGLSRQEFVRRKITEIALDNQPNLYQLKTGRRLVAIQGRTIIEITQINPSVTSLVRNDDPHTAALVEKARLLCLKNEQGWQHAKDLLADNNFEVFDDGAYNRSNSFGGQPLD